MKYRTKTCEDFYGKNYTGQGNRPAVIFSLGFCFDWYIGKGDFYSYMKRPEAFDKNIHAMDAEYNSTSDFFDYMENSEKSDGIFDSNSDLVSEEQIDKYRALEMKARDDGAPKYFGVISFDNDFLKEQGAMTGRSLDIKRIKEIARKSMAQMIQTSNKLDADNVFWTAAIHTNTDNVHVHFSICEKECRHRKKDMLEVRAFDALKSSVVNSFVGSENTIELTKMQRQVLLPLFERSSDACREQLAALRRILPKNKNLWQYNRKDIEPLREQINVCVESIVKNTSSLQDTYNEYLEMLDAQTERLKSYYGDGNRHLYLNYKKNRLIDLQARLGNSLLNQLAQLDDTILENRFDTEGPEKKESSSTKMIESIDLQIDSFMQRQLERSEDETLIEKLGDVSDYDDVETEAHPPEKEPVTPYIAWSYQFKEAQRYLYGDETKGIKPDKEKARTLLEAEGARGNALADFLLGRLLYADDRDKSEDAYKRAFEKFSAIHPGTDFERQYIEYKLGVMCQRGLGTEINLHDAVMHFEASDMAPANYALGSIYRYNEDYRDVEKAFEYYKAAAAQDLPYAHYALGRCYEKGEGTVTNAELAQKSYSDACARFESAEKKQSNDSLQFRLGFMCYYGKGVEQNTEKAIEWLDKSAEHRNVDACLMLAKIYSSDKKVKNTAKAVELYLSEALLDNPQAQYALGKLYLSDELYDENKAEHYLTLSAEKDNEYGQYALGKLKLGQNDRQSAEHWLKLSADKHNNEFAQYALGKLYLSDELYDENKAEHYLTLSAEKDNEYAQYALGKLKLGQNDKQSAEHWLKLSADKHNNEFAQYALGKLYLSDGYYNHEEARKYYALAAGQGNKYAQAALQRGLYLPGQKPRIEHNKDYLGRGAGNVFRDVRKVQYQMIVISGELTRAMQRTMNESEHHLRQLMSEYEYDQKLQELNMQRQMASRAI